MKKILTRNIGLKVLSVILAALLWLVITNVDNPIESKTFRDVLVQVLHEDVISSLDQVYEITENNKIDFKVSARRNILDNLSQSDFRVTADFANLSNVNAVNIEITCPRYGDNVIVTDGKNQMMKISLEELMEKNFKVNIVPIGKVAEGYFVGEKKAVPNIIRVSGPKGRVERIKEVVVSVDVSDATGSLNTRVKPKVLDEDGKEIEATNLKFSDNTVNVNLDLYKTKTINLQISTTGNPADGYVVNPNVEFEPKTIVIAGDDDALRSISYLSIKESVIGATQNISKEINLQDELDKLDKNIQLVGDDKTAVINIQIDRLESKVFNLWSNDIEVRNVPPDLKMDYNSTGPYSVELQGPLEELSKITMALAKPYIDLTDYQIGTYALEVEMMLPNDVKLVTKPKVYFSLTMLNS